MSKIAVPIEILVDFIILYSLGAIYKFSGARVHPSDPNMMAALAGYLKTTLTDMAPEPNTFMRLMFGKFMNLFTNNFETNDIDERTSTQTVLKLLSVHEIHEHTHEPDTARRTGIACCCRHHMLLLVSRAIDIACYSHYA